MKKTSKLLRGLTLAALILGALAFVGCELTITSTPLTFGARGSVIDGDTGSGLGSVTVQLNALEAGGENLSATTDSSGQYTFADIEPGEYELTASSSGLAFIKQRIQVSSAAESGQRLPNIVGYDVGAGKGQTGTTDLKFIVVWDPNFMDVDGYMTFPDPGTASFSEQPINIDNYYDLTGVPDGFGPLNTTDRAQVFWNNKRTSAENDNNDPLIELNVDDTGDGEVDGGPETITVRGVPWSASLGTNVDRDGSALNFPEGKYYWTGVMEYYLDAFSADSDLERDSNAYLGYTEVDGASWASPRVFVLQGDNQLGYYEIPEYTNIQKASVIRINTFFRDTPPDTSDGVGEEFFQILPDIRIVQSGSDFRSASGNTGILVSGRAITR
jgi:hypothetical protein